MQLAQAGLVGRNFRVSSHDIEAHYSMNINEASGLLPGPWTRHTSEPYTGFCALEIEARSNKHFMLGPHGSYVGDLRCTCTLLSLRIWRWHKVHNGSARLLYVGLDEQILDRKVFGSQLALLRLSKRTAKTHFNDAYFYSANS